MLGKECRWWVILCMSSREKERASGLYVPLQSYFWDAQRTLVRVSDLVTWAEKRTVDGHVLIKYAL